MSDLPKLHIARTRAVADEVRTLMAPLLAEARARDKWLYCTYQDLWFSPDALERAQAEGSFCWGPANWRLRDPRERLVELEKKARDAENEFRQFIVRLMLKP